MLCTESWRVIPYFVPIYDVVDYVFLFTLPSSYLRYLHRIFNCRFNILTCFLHQSLINISLRYTVANGDNANRFDFASANALTVPLTYTIIDGLGNVASLVLPIPGSVGSLSFSRLVIIDTLPPQPLALVMSNPSSVLTVYGKGLNLSMSLLFQEVLYVFGGIPVLKLNVASGSAALLFIGGSGTNALNFRCVLLLNHSVAVLCYIKTR